eukprot:2872545-Lingulodinium_polyedra.AAC.1
MEGGTRSTACYVAQWEYMHCTNVAGFLVLPGCGRWRKYSLTMLPTYWLPRCVQHTSDRPLYLSST